MAVLSTSHLPAIYQHGTARINWALTCYTLIVSFFPLCLLALRQQRCAYTYDEHGEYDAERSHGVNLHPLVNEHLHTDEEQQYAYAGLQIAEAVGDGCQEEEHSTQAEDGEDVREEHHIRVERHREHSRNAVERNYSAIALCP